MDFFNYAINLYLVYVAPFMYTDMVNVGIKTILALGVAGTTVSSLASWGGLNFLKPYGT